MRWVGEVPDVNEPDENTNDGDDFGEEVAKVV
jgi:hypothetical protein